MAPGLVQRDLADDRVLVGVDIGRRRAVDDIQVALLGVLGVAAADRHVQLVVEDRRRPGGLAEGAVAGRRHVAGPIQRDRVEVQRQGRIGRAGGVPLQRVRGLGVVADLLAEIEDAADILDAVGLADQLQFLAGLILPDAGDAVAGEGGVRREHRQGHRAVVELGLGQLAVRADRLQVQIVGQFPGQVQAMAPGVALAHLQRYADAGAIGAVRLDRRQRGQGQGALLLQLHVVRGRTVVREIVGVVGAEGLRRTPGELQVQAALVVAVEVRLARGSRVDRRAVALGQKSVDLEAEALVFRQIDVGLELVAIVIAVAERGVHAEHAGRGLGDDADRAALGVAAEQRALRPLQHLDTFDVIQRRAQALGAAEIDAVDIDADGLVASGLVGVAEGADAAHADRQRRLAGEERGHAQRRDRAVAQVFHRLDVTGLQGLAVHGRDGDRRVLQIGLALLGGDHDLLEAGRAVAGSGGGFRRAGRAAKS